MKLLQLTGLLISTGLISACNLGGGGGGDFSQMDSLRQELQAEQILNAQYETYIQDVCLPERARAKDYGKDGAPTGGGDLNQSIAYPKLNMRRIRGKNGYILSTRLEYLPNAFQLTEDMQAELKPIADSLVNRDQLMVTIEGHTDNQEYESSNLWQHSWQLANARAAEVAQYLVLQGVFPTSIRCISRGKFQPVASNRSPDGQKWNRRVEIVLTLKTPKNK